MSYTPSVNTIFDIVRGYMEVPSTISSCNSDFPDPPTVPVANFQDITGINMPERESFISHTIPTDAQVNPTTIAPAYSDTYSDIATIALSDISSATYGIYKLPSTLPSDTAGKPDTDYPEAAFIEIKTSAGLDGTLTAPSITVGTLPDFLAIPELSYDLTDLSPLDATQPTVDGLPEIDVLESPDALAHTIDPDLIASLKNGLDGNIVLPQNAQNIMAARELRKIDDAFDEAERALFTESAAAGFENSNGPLLGKLAELLYDVNFKDREVWEKVRADVYDKALAQLETAIKESFVLETANVAIHMAYVSKLVETLKFNVAMQTEYANLLIDQFNTQMKLVRQIVSAYESYISTRLTEYDAKIAEINVAKAKIDTNAAKITAYDAQIGTIETQVKIFEDEVKLELLPLEEYQTYIKGILANVDIARTNIDAFKQAIKAYSQAIDSNAAKLDGYAEQIRATGSATGVYETNWGAYAQAQSAKAASDSARQSWYQSSLQGLRAEISEFEAAAQAQRSYYQTLTSWANANSRMYNDYAQAVDAKISYTTGYNRHSVAYEEAETNIDLAQEDADVRMAALEAQATAVQESINIGLAAAEATAAAGCAQAAYSIKSISASVSARAGVSDSGSTSSNCTRSKGTTRSYSFNKSRTISA